MTTSSFESGIFDPVSGEGQGPRRRPGKSKGTPDSGGADGTDAQAKRDKILNAYFDGESTISRERLRSAMRADPRLAVDFERTEAVLSEMNLSERPVGGPDVSQAVLARVDELLPYVETPIRRQVSSARVAAVGAILCGITLVVVLNQVRVSTMPTAQVADSEPKAATPVPTATPPIARTASLKTKKQQPLGLGSAAHRYDPSPTAILSNRVPSAAGEELMGVKEPAFSLRGGGSSSDAEFISLHSSNASFLRPVSPPSPPAADQYWSQRFFGQSIIFANPVFPRVDFDQAARLGDLKK